MHSSTNHEADRLQKQKATPYEIPISYEKETDNEFKF